MSPSLEWGGWLFGPILGRSAYSTDSGHPFHGKAAFGRGGAPEEVAAKKRERLEAHQTKVKELSGQIAKPKALA